MIKKILSSTDPKLRVVSKPIIVIDKKIEDLAKDLKDTLIAQKDPEGVGLAAPQIGKNTRMFAMIQGKEIKIVLNPEIVSLTDGKKKKIKNPSILEGCLSVPYYYGPLIRPQKVKLRYLDLNDRNEKEEEITGFSAQIIQHEVDHLNGILFVDRLLEQEKPLYKLVNDEWEEVDF